jgi:hypothetical protein
METIERYRYALARPNPTPETSLLNVPLSRRARQNESLPDSLDSWTSRSRLGEPEALPIEPAQQGEEAKPKWSFWRKNTAEKPLVTSGGGVLEVKSLSGSPAPVLMEPRPSSVGVMQALAPTMSSRPASPIPAILPAVDITPAVQPSAGSTEPVVPAQSAVTRFFGRLSRRPTSQSTHDDDDDNKDLALSADDFSFLDQVPSITPQSQDRNVGDLLAYEGGRTESMASLESMLNSKATPLPAPLAPPPTWSRSSSSAGPSYQKPKEMDFLEGLDFGDDMGSSSLQTSQSAQPVSSSTAGSEWDQFLSSSTHTPAPTSAVPMISSDMPHRSFTPPITPSALSPPPSLRPQQTKSAAVAGSSYSSPALQFSSAPAATNDFDDFVDFAPAPAASAKVDDFDDFGDFGDFSTSTPAVQSNAYSTPIHASSTLQPPPSTGHAKRASLDHTLTLNLINDASAVKGKRWPAPPSPLAPQLDPPPKAANTSTSFPFLTPPPGGRSTSGFGDLLDGGANTTNATSQSSPPNRMQSPPIAPTMAMAPTRTASPLTRPPTNASPINPATLKPAQPGQSGLSAQDLSFFDSL